MTRAEVKLIQSTQGENATLSVSNRDFAWNIITALLGKNTVIDIDELASENAGYDIYSAKDNVTFDSFTNVDCNIADLKTRFEITFKDTNNSYNIWIK